MLAVLLPLASIVAQDVEPRPFTAEDIHRVVEVRELAVAPKGDWVAYTLRSTDTGKDRTSSDLFMVSWDGSTRIQLTQSDGSESRPRFSPDGKYLAFLTARGGDDSGSSKDPAAKSQVWLLNRSGGEAQRLTELEGGVSSFEWSEDSTRLVLVSKDPKDEDDGEGEKDADNDKTHKTPEPIVIDRYQFKRDRVGYLDNRYQRIYVFDVATKKATLLTPGRFDSTGPAWSPDGKRIAFTSKREGDPDRHRNTDIYVVEAREGAEPRQITTWKGPDSRPVFSPDGTKIAYLQGGTPKYSGYDPAQLAVVSVSGGEPVLPTEELDRNVSSPRWSKNGSQLYFLFADDRQKILASVPAEGGKVERHFPSESGVVRSFEVGAKGAVGIVTFPQRPAELYRLADAVALSNHNRQLQKEIAWASVEGFDTVRADGTRIGSMLLKPPGFQKGGPYPTVALIHGGPVGQDGFEFDAMAQAIAAQGYLVVNPNYRGSSGRGREFSRAIYADWGNLEIQDIHAVMDHLVAEGLADPDRLGIGGWSYGGMNTNYAIATDTRFRAAVSGASISNMITGYGTDQYVWQYENELGLPWKSIETYLKISYPFFHADRIQTPTLFMCGEKDFNVPLINSEQMYQALRSLDVPTQLVIYPGQFHGLSKPSYVQDRIERMIGWYDKYLAGKGRPEPTDVLGR